MDDQQTATDRHTSGKGHPPLRRPQLDALEALGAGATVTEAARQAGVDRTTVHRWLRDSFSFQAAWNRLRRDMERETEARIERLAQEALGAVEAAVASGDARVALAVLKGVGLLGGARAEIGAPDPGDLEAERRIATAEADSKRALRELTAGIGVMR